LSLRLRSVLLPTFALVLLSGLALASARPASAAACWQRVLADWKDGRIDGTYTAPCLRAAIVHMPEDLKIYGSAEDDITRELNGLQARRLASTRHTSSSSTSKAEPAAGSRSLSGRKAKPKREPVQRVAEASKPHDTGGGFPIRTLLLILAAVSAVSVLGAATVRGLRS
jgi:hypothetical protein